MKKFVNALIMVMVMSVAASESYAQVIVRVRPARPRTVFVRPPAPSPRHVWVDEEWAPRGRGYAWRGGYWAEPPRSRAVWIPGHWRDTPRGSMWIKGHWR